MNMCTATKIRSFVTFWVVMAALALPTMVAAQEDDPLRLVYLNVSGEEGATSFSTVDDLFAESQQIDLVDGEKLMEFAAEFGLDEASFRSGQRTEYMDEFAAVMWELNIEGVMVHQVDTGADVLYIGVVGPHGWELAEVEAPLSQGSLDRDGALTALGEIFDPLVPEVRGFRRDVAEGRITDDDFQLPERIAEEDEEKEEVDEEMSLREQAMAEHRKTYGDLGRSISAYVGPVFGHRSLRMSGDGGFDLRHRAPLVGFGLRADSMVTTFDRDTAALEVGAVFAMSSVSTFYDSSELGGQFFLLSGEARYINAQSAFLRIRGVAGVETMNITLDENDEYTGHGYLAGRIGGGAEYDFGDLMTLKADALAMPVISASNSGDAYGEVSGWLGAGLDLGARLEVAAPVLIGADYGFRLFHVDYPEADRADGVGGEADSYDMFHQFMISVGYRL